MFLNQTVTPAPTAIFQEVEGEGVLLNMESAEYFGLDETGARVWELITEYGSTRKVFEQMLEEFDVDAERLEADLEALVRDLVQNGLVTLGPDEP